MSLGKKHKPPKAHPEDILAFIARERPKLVGKFADDEMKRTFNEVPKSGTPLGPKPVDPDKALVTDPKNIERLASEWDAFVATPGSRLSAPSIAVLRNNNVNPSDAKAVSAFIANQRRLIHSPVPPP